MNLENMTSQGTLQPWPVTRGKKVIMAQLPMGVGNFLCSAMSAKIECNILKGHINVMARRHRENTIFFVGKVGQGIYQQSSDKTH